MRYVLLPVVLFASLLLLGGCSGSDGPAPSAAPAGGRPGSTPPSDTPVPTAADATPTATPGSLPIEEIEGAYLSEHFAPGELIERESGAFFMDTATGAVERVALAPEYGERFYSSISDDSNLILTFGQDRNWLLNRETETAAAWPSSAFTVLALGPGYLVLQDRTTESVVLLGADLSPGPLLDLPGDAVIVGAAFAPDGQRIVLSGSAEAGALLYVLDSATGDLLDLSDEWTTPEGYTGAHVFTRDAGAGMFAAWAEYPREKPSTETMTRVVLYRYDGSRVMELPEGANAPVMVSPDGTRVAWQEPLRAIEPMTIGGGEYWPNVVMADIESGEILFRARGAELGYGDELHGNRWLADSSGLVVAGRVTGNALERGYAPLNEYFVIDRDGAGMVALEGNPYAYQHGPVPSPHDADLVALGRSTVLHRGTGEVVAAPWDPFDTGHVAPWGSVPGELRFTVPHGGHDGGILTVQALPVRIDFPPFDDRLRFVVTGTGDCLNVRDLPGVTLEFGPDVPTVESDVSGCLPDGTTLELTNDPSLAERFPEIFYDTHAARLGYDTGATWLHVRAEDGTEGWVAGEFLDWAE